jgi:EAL domain-containing protein (putative c-di-GMP-specific phosphodiesterase class I)
VLELHADSDDAAIVSSTVGLSKKLGLSVIAEGIESRATVDVLMSMGRGRAGLFLRSADAAQAFEDQFLTVRAPAARVLDEGEAA